MIRHIVMFKFRKAAEGADRAVNIQRIKSELEALPAKIDEIKFFEVGINFSNTNAACDLVLCSEFESKEALYSYQKHPDHVKVAQLVGRVCDERVVADYIV